MAYGLAGLGGRIAARLAKGRRAQVERNVRRITGRDSPEAVREVFASYAQYWVESFRLPGISPEALDAGFDITGWEHVETAREAGTGAILALPHLGGWEWGGFWVATVKKVPISVVVEPLEPPEMFEWFADYRRDLGMNVVPLGEGAGRAVMRALKDNHVVSLLQRP